MREIPLTRAAVALVDDEDYERIARHKWHLTSTGYAARDARNRKSGTGEYVLMHREILGFPGEPHVDHMNHNTVDNRKANLRPCSASDNQGNRQGKKGGLKGVWRHKTCDRWQAEIRRGDTRVHLGLFRSREAAARAYDVAAVEIFGDFANLNFPDESAA